MGKNTRPRNSKSKKKDDTPSYDTLVNTIKSEIVQELKADLKEHIITLREDLRADLAERPAPAPAPVQAPAVGPDISGIMDMLKGGNLDMSKITQLMGNMQSAPRLDEKGQPIDMSKLTEGQIEFMKMEQQNKMLMTFLPLLFGNTAGGGNQVLTEMMNRIFLEKINSSLYMDKMIIQNMAKNMGIKETPPDTGLTTPISNMLNAGAAKSAIQ